MNYILPRAILLVTLSIFGSNTVRCSSSENLGLAADIFEHQGAVPEYLFSANIEIPTDQLSSFCDTKVENQKGTIEVLMDEGKKSGLKYEKVSPGTIPYLLGLDSGAVLVRTKSNDFLWESWEGKGLPGICDRRYFKLNISVNGQLQAITVLDKSLIYGSPDSPYKSYIVEFYSIIPPREPKYRSFASIARTVSVPKSEYSEQCNAGVPKKVKFAPIAEGMKIQGIHLIEVPRSSFFFILGFRDDDIIRQESPDHGSENQWENGSIPELCAASNTSFLLERHGNLTQVERHFESVGDNGAVAPASTIHLETIMEPIYEPDIPTVASTEDTSQEDPETNRLSEAQKQERLQALTAQFPNNLFLAEQVDPAKSSKLKSRRSEIFRLSTKMVKREATCSEVNTYYDYKNKHSDDRIFLLKHTVATEDLSPDLRNKFQSVIQMEEDRATREREKRIKELKFCL